jgi:hypothetical protein
MLTLRPAGVTAVISMLPSTEHVADAYEGVSVGCGLVCHHCHSSLPSYHCQACSVILMAVGDHVRYLHVTGPQEPLCWQRWLSRIQGAHGHQGVLSTVCLSLGHVAALQQLSVSSTATHCRGQHTHSVAPAVPLSTASCSAAAVVAFFLPFPVPWTPPTPLNLLSHTFPPTLLPTAPRSVEGRGWPAALPAH